MAKSNIKVGITDDHTLMREGLANIIDSMPEFNVMMQASDGEDLCNQLEETGEWPDVMLLDINMPVMDGYKTMAIVNEKYPDIKVIALSMYDNEFTIIQMFRLGARGFVEKGKSSEVLRQALLTVYNGGFFHEGEFTENILAKLQSGESLKGITPREREFLGWCCTELNYREIADKMDVSERTAHGYRDILFEKLNLKTRTGLVIYALKAGIVTG